MKIQPTRNFNSRHIFIFLMQKVSYLVYYPHGIWALSGNLFPL